ncbi:Short chain oxidoreductase [Acanthamoeba castellanii str. Neff]|uniref:Short chain oxidoreductase n=1 Tax=Acanthamoeba castellanii (strain ATCC 30010 / Neff) TaxID=1257118 RepID=L8GEE8_ACACF|nr:Short chain oxidoreductase [Acanthamoeba castellanii str. Neff]ELR11475.1 Short chain oxidoreductase [Acanthamoeba castellanii str. Neff]
MAIAHIHTAHMKTALVTGASRGIGLQLVKELLGEGYAVVATCRAPATSTGLQDLLHTRQRGRLLGVVPLDVSDGRSVTAALATVTGELGLTSLDVLINNAGVATAKHPDEPVLEATAEDMQSVFTTNVVGPMLVTQTFYPLLLASSSSSSLASALPKVVNVSSRMGSISLYQDISRGGATSASYRVSKAALNMLTKCFAVEHADECIHIAIHPGWVQTELGSSHGRKPPVTPEQSAKGIVSVLQGLKKDDNGSFFNFDGQQLAW